MKAESLGRAQMEEEKNVIRARGTREREWRTHHILGRQKRFKKRIEDIRKGSRGSHVLKVEMLLCAGSDLT